MLHRSFPEADIDKRLWTPLLNLDKKPAKPAAVLPGAIITAKRLILGRVERSDIIDRFRRSIAVDDALEM